MTGENPLPAVGQSGGPYGLAAEFEKHDELVRAAEKAYAQGFRSMDAYAPFPVEGLSEALGQTNRLPQLILAGGIVGGLIAYGMQWYANVVSYPINVGGRPLHSWPAFVPITFELTVLGAALTAFFFSLGLSGLPEAISSGVQYAGIRESFAGSFLSLHRGKGSEIRHLGDTPIS